MAEFDIVAIPIEPNYVTFDDLSFGRTTQQIVGRLLRFWESRNINRDNELMSLDFLLLDEKNSVIQCSIPPPLTNHFHPQLREGLIVNIRGFEVGRCSNVYKISDHPFLIRFLPTTTIVVLPHAATTIRMENFRIRKVDHLQAIANTNLELPDVVGQIRFVQGSNLDDPTCTERLVIRFRVDMFAHVYLSLWDAAAANFRSHLTSGENMSSVMVVTSTNPKLFRGNLYLNSTQATKFFFDTTIHAIEQFTTSLGIKSTEPFQCAETKAGLHKKETVTIQELYNYISQPSEQIQDSEFLCKAQVVGILQTNGWSYVSCPVCSKKMDKHKTNFRCNRCATQNVAGVLRYRVELAVYDGASHTTFVVFDSEMAKLTKKSAATLILEEGDVGNGNELPNCLRALVGMHLVFQIRVTPTNYIRMHQPFIVSAITNYE